MSSHTSRPSSIGRSRSRRRAKGPPRDLIDFYRRWPEFREVAAAIARRADLSAQQRETVNWLISLVDRIGENDVGSPEKSHN